MHRDNALAILLTTVDKLEAQGVRPTVAPKGYDVEADVLLAKLLETPIRELRNQHGQFVVGHEDA
jgi:hypothetical protein